MPTTVLWVKPSKCSNHPIQRRCGCSIQTLIRLRARWRRRPPHVLPAGWGDALPCTLPVAAQGNAPGRGAAVGRSRGSPITTPHAVVDEHPGADPGAGVDPHAREAAPAWRAAAASKRTGSARGRWPETDAAPAAWNPGRQSRISRLPRAAGVALAMNPEIGATVLQEFAERGTQADGKGGTGERNGGGLLGRGAKAAQPGLG